MEYRRAEMGSRRLLRVIGGNGKMQLPHAVLKRSVRGTSDQDVELREIVRVRCASGEEEVGRQLLAVKGAMVRGQAA